MAVFVAASKKTTSAFSLALAAILYPIVSMRDVTHKIPVVDLLWPKATCDVQFSLQPRIEYDSRQNNLDNQRRPAQVLALRAVSGYLDVEKFGVVERVGFESQLVASNVEAVNSEGGGNLSINAIKIDHVKSWQEGMLSLVARQVESISNLGTKGELCGNLHDVKKIENISGVLSLWGSYKTKEPAEIGLLGQSSGVIHLNDFNVGEISANTIRVHLRRSSLRQLGGGDGVVILENSKLQRLGAFKGQVILRGQSSVQTIQPDFSGTLLRE